MKVSFKTAPRFYRLTCIKIDLAFRAHSSKLLFAAGIFLLSSGLISLCLAQQVPTYHQPNYNDTLVRNAVGNLFGLIEGAFGALIMVVSGLGAIVAAAMGAYRAAVGMLVVAVGAFILRALVSLFFGEDYEAFNVERE